MPLILTTQRLILRPLRIADLSQIISVGGSHTVQDTTISLPYPMKDTAAQDWIDSTTAESQNANAAHFAITVSPDEQRLIGYIAIKASDPEHKEGELSFWLDELYGGKGYATEAANAVVAFGFRHLDLNRICAYHMVRNIASQRVLIKLGFQQEGHLRQRVHKWGVYEDVLLWSRLHSDPERSSLSGEPLS